MVSLTSRRRWFCNRLNRLTNYHDISTTTSNFIRLFFGRQEGRFWVNDELGMIVEVPASTLAGEDAPLEIIELGEGLSCKVLIDLALKKIEERERSDYTLISFRRRRIRL